MAIQISGTTVINNNRELGSGLVSAYDNVTASGGGANVGNRTVYCVTSDAQTINLPSSPSPGNEVLIINGGEFVETVVGRAGSNIMGLAEDITLDIKYAAVTFLYINSSNGWRVS